MFLRPLIRFKVFSYNFEVPTTKHFSVHKGITQIAVILDLKGMRLRQHRNKKTRQGIVPIIITMQNHNPLGPSFIGVIARVMKLSLDQSTQLKTKFINNTQQLKKFVPDESVYTENDGTKENKCPSLV